MTDIKWKKLIKNGYVNERIIKITFRKKSENGVFWKSKKK